MIKRLLTTCILVLSLSLAAQAQVKIAVIDMKRAFDEYYKTKDAQALLQDRYTKIQQELQEYRDDYQRMVDEANKLRDAVNDKTLAQAARDDKQKALEAKAQDINNEERKIQEFQTERGHQFEDQRIRMMKGIVDEIVKVVNDTGVREKYSLIMDKSGTSTNGTNVILYSQDVKDITDDVIKAINATKPATSGAPATTPATPATAPAAPAPAPATH